MFERARDKSNNDQHVPPLLFCSDDFCFCQASSSRMINAPISLRYFCHIPSVIEKPFLVNTLASPKIQALVGTLRAAKKRKVIKYEGEMLLQGAHDKVGLCLFV
jgi:hypothetical protein